MRLHCCFFDIIHAEERVLGVGAAQDARRKHDGQRVGGHAVVRLFFSNPVSGDTNHEASSTSTQKQSSYLIV